MMTNKELQNRINNWTKEIVQLKLILQKFIYYQWFNLFLYFFAQPRMNVAIYLWKSNAITVRKIYWEICIVINFSALQDHLLMKLCTWTTHAAERFWIVSELFFTFSINWIQPKNWQFIQIFRTCKLAIKHSKVYWVYTKLHEKSAKTEKKILLF